MIYQKTVLTPANTLSSAPQIDRLRVSKGLVYKVEVEFPSGPLGLTGCAILDGGFQVWPSNINEWFSSNARLIEFDDMYLKEVEPYEFQIASYNTDEEYEHRVFIRLGLVGLRTFQARFMPHLAWEDFAKVLEEMRAAPYVEEQVPIEETEEPFPGPEPLYEE